MLKLSNKIGAGASNIATDTLLSCKILVYLNLYLPIPINPFLLYAHLQRQRPIFLHHLNSCTHFHHPNNPFELRQRMRSCSTTYFGYHRHAVLAAAAGVAFAYHAAPPSTSCARVKLNCHEQPWKVSCFPSHSLL